MSKVKKERIWLAVHHRIGVCPGISRGATKKEIESYIKEAAGQFGAQHYTVELFELTPVKRNGEVKE